MTALTLAARAPNARQPGFFSQISAEWTKLRSVRAFYVQIGLALILAIGLSALICLAVTSRWDNSRHPNFHPVVTSLIGHAFTDIVLTVTGVTLIASEYTSGMIRLTMVVTPSRLRVLFAKAIVLVAATWAIGLVAALGSFFAGQAVLGTHAGIPTASLGDSAAKRGSSPPG